MANFFINFDDGAYQKQIRSSYWAAFFIENAVCTNVKVSEISVDGFKFASVDVKSIVAMANNTKRFGRRDVADEIEAIARRIVPPVIDNT